MCEIFLAKSNRQKENRKLLVLPPERKTNIKSLHQTRYLLKHNPVVGRDECTAILFNLKVYSYSASYCMCEATCKTTF